MRKLSAILLIGLFTFSQYARQLSYLECKLSNVFKPDASQCDCGKKTISVEQGNHQSPVSKVHLHIHLDQFFSVAKEIDINSAFRQSAAIAILSNDDECEGNLPQPWQPPNA